MIVFGKRSTITKTTLVPAAQEPENLPPQMHHLHETERRQQQTTIKAYLNSECERNKSHRSANVDSILSWKQRTVNNGKFIVYLDFKMYLKLIT